MGTAPRLSANSDSAAERLLLAAYHEWRVHYERCAVCNPGSWFEPDFTVRPCRIGQVRFRRWVTLGIAMTVPQLRPSTVLCKEDDA